MQVLTRRSVERNNDGDGNRTHRWRGAWAEEVPCPIYARKFSRGTRIPIVPKKLHQKRMQLGEVTNKGGWEED